MHLSNLVYFLLMGFSINVCIVFQGHVFLLRRQQNAGAEGSKMGHAEFPLRQCNGGHVDVVCCADGRGLAAVSYLLLIQYCTRSLELQFEIFCYFSLFYCVGLVFKCRPIIILKVSKSSEPVAFMNEV